MKNKKEMKIFCITGGIISALLMVFDLILLSKIQPKMLAFQTLTTIEETMLTVIGFTFLFFLLFHILTTYRLFSWTKLTQNVTPKIFILIALIIISGLSIFGDVALLSDIAKQYKSGFEQPEWLLLFPFLISQFITILIFTFVNIFGLKDDKGEVVKEDGSIFLVTQYIGILCGILGLGFTSIGFLYSTGWSVELHTILTSVLLLLPYGISGGFWFVEKFKERKNQLCDEKQVQDMGKSALLSLPISIVFMVVFFVIDFYVLNITVNYSWLPLYVFLNLFAFSLGTLYFNTKE